MELNSLKVCIFLHPPEAYSELFETSKMELFAELINSRQPLKVVNCCCKKP